MSIAKLRVGDHVKVIAGRSKNSIGKIMKINCDQIYVQGVNLLKKTIRVDKSKPVEEQNRNGFREVEAPIHRSNVALYDTKLECTIKVAIQEVNEKRVRVNRKTGEVILKEVEAN